MNPEQTDNFQPGIGSTADLNLRISVATLVRVLFKDPFDGEWMLALERKATLQENEGDRVVTVKSQPFGGAIRILDLRALQKKIGNFHFDSESSGSERDFRIFVRFADWHIVREFCLGHFGDTSDTVLETDPTRELTEEFADTLGIELKRDQYSTQEVGTIVEDLPSATENTHARGYATTRIYRIYEARILDPSLSSAMIANSRGCTDQDLHELARRDSRNGRAGHANAVLTLPYKEVSDFYLASPAEVRNRPVFFLNHQLDETVAAVLDDVSVPKYRRV